ncbi:MAG: biotin/lipoyl-binding protein [Bacteroidia bacterium]|nr:biotin/lipoyl-binding protein [Bacteroidia bacterium]
MKKFKLTIEGKSYDVSVDEIDKTFARVDINGKSLTVEIEREGAKLAQVPVSRVASSCQSASRKSVSGVISSPLPGNIVKIMVSVGQAVKRGDTLIVIESMKMENNIKADRDGVVKAIKVDAGQAVMQGDTLVDFESVGVSQEAPVDNTKQEVPAAAPKLSAKAASASTVISPLPGNIIKVLVSEGKSVKRGDTILTIESMKMENSIKAASDGVVKKIYVQQAQSVMQGDSLFDLE